MSVLPVKVNNLHKSYGNLHVLRGIDLEIAQGEFAVLLGANGCGKSTLIRCLNGLTEADEGDIWMLGIRVTDRRRRELRAVRRRVGVVFQQFNLIPNLSVFQNVLFGAMGHHRPGLLKTMAPLASDALREKAMECLARVGLADRASRMCRELSGGQQQRIAIARTLIQDPEIIIADEPVASLDPRVGREVMDLLQSIVEERKIAVICSLHQLDIARDYGDRVLGMKAGRILMDSPRSRLDPDSVNDLYQGAARVDDEAA